MVDCNPVVRMNSENVKVLQKGLGFNVNNLLKNPDKDIKSCDLGIEYSSEVNDPAVF